ncbi:MAG: phosphomannomutase [Candidatus Tectimicrobiota bacterium]|nr:MAG: phosphomannomutase [Candidatus Tectomicrobia bacterium]
MLQRLEQGFAPLPVAEAYKQAAQAQIARWLTEARFAPYRPQLEWLIAQERWSLLLDSFYRMLPFGTGGRRGPVGIGTNRFNPWTLALSVQGHVAYLRERYPGQDLSVVIAYDVRVFHDLRGLYNPDLPNPLRGISSRDFARVAAGVYAANGVRVYMLPDAYLSTPELSFAIRHLKATAGLNISASHNHPDDNGGKFYNDRGAQEVPPHDEEMARHVERSQEVQQLDFEAAKATGLVSWIPPEVHEAYLALNLAQSVCPEARRARLVFTPLHGTGDRTVGAVLARAGFEVHLVAEQATHDGAFPAVPYRAPNPEVPESMQLGVALAQRLDADAVLACDPDADRIGVCARAADGTYPFLTGNEIAVLVTYFKLEQLQRRGRLPRRPLVIKTEVTTELLRPITEHFGGVLIGDLLVGFKYHAHVLDCLERRGRFRDVEARLEDFVVGVEESHGVLVTPAIRDKDAAGAALLLAELAALQRQQGATLLDYLDDIYRRFGYYATLLASMVMTGAEGLSHIQKIQDALRQRPPEKVAQWAVTRVVDHWDERGIYGPILSETDRASRNVLVFTLENGARIIIRPSGTEPKNKVYIEVPTPPLGPQASAAALAQQKAEARAVARRLADDFTHQMLALIGVHLPDYALRLSDLVPLDKRLDFVERFLPELEARVERLCQGEIGREAVSQWIDTALAAYGKDARGLVREAMQAYLEGERQRLAQLAPAAAQRRRRLLEAMHELFFEGGRPA